MSAPRPVKGLSPFRKMLNKIAKNLDSEDLESFKLLVSDDIPVAALEDVTPVVLMLKLVEYNLILEDNLDVLKEALHEIGKDNLIKIVEEYDRVRERESMAVSPILQQRYDAQQSSGAGQNNYMPDPTSYQVPPSTHLPQPSHSADQQHVSPEQLPGRGRQPRAITKRQVDLTRQCSQPNHGPQNIGYWPPPLSEIIASANQRQTDQFDAGPLSVASTASNMTQTPMLPLLPVSPEKSPSQNQTGTSHPLLHSERSHSLPRKSEPSAGILQQSPTPPSPLSAQSQNEEDNMTLPARTPVNKTHSLDEIHDQASSTRTPSLRPSLSDQTAEVTPQAKTPHSDQTVVATKRTPPVGKATIMRGRSNQSGDLEDPDQTSEKQRLEPPSPGAPVALTPVRMPVPTDDTHDHSAFSSDLSCSLNFRSNEIQDSTLQSDHRRSEDSSDVRTHTSLELSLRSEEPDGSMDVLKRQAHDSMDVLKRQAHHHHSESSDVDSMDILKRQNQGDQLQSYVEKMRMKHEQDQVEIEKKHNMGKSSSESKAGKIATDGPVEHDDEDSDDGESGGATAASDPQILSYREIQRIRYEKQQQTNQPSKDTPDVEKQNARQNVLDCDGAGMKKPLGVVMSKENSVAHPLGDCVAEVKTSKSSAPHTVQSPGQIPVLDASKLHTDSPAQDPSPGSSPDPEPQRPHGTGARPKTTSSQNAYNVLRVGRPLQPNPARIQAMLENATDSIRRMALSEPHDPRADDQLMRAAGVKKEKLKETRKKERERKGRETVTLYSYQYELAEPALQGHNCILCAPTGSGKTFTAGYVCEKLWDKADEENKPFKALFIVCIRNLINQQTEALRQLICAHDDRYSLIEGINETAKLTEMLQSRNVVVLTAQILVNCLKNKEMTLRDIDLLIMDECHHTNENHPYNIIMKFYHEEKRKSFGRPLPQILGLTASLGVGANKDNAIKHYILMCANLDCTKITHVRQQDNLRELLKQNPRPGKDQIIGVNPRDKNELFVIILQYMMREIETNTESLPQIRPPRITQHYENWIVQLRKSAEENNMQDAIYCCKTLQKLNTALMLFDEIRAKDVLPILEEHFAELYRSEAPRRLEAMIHGLYDQQKGELRELTDKEQLGDNQKLERLAGLLFDLYTCQPESKGILLTRTRVTVEGLRSFVADQPTLQGLVRSAKFVGQGRKEGTMTDVDQELTLISFRETEPDSYNLLVATDVAQEGLDMPQCNFVIRYNFVSNEIGSVQSKGRARAKNSECYLIVNKNSAEEVREYENLQKEHLMMEALEDIVHIDQDELHRHIREAQDSLYVREQKQQERKAISSTEFDVQKVTIYCKNCKDNLCDGRDMRKRGSSYIATAIDFNTKVMLRKYQTSRDFRYDYHIGDLICTNRTCNRKVGLQVNYKEGTRSHGYVLSKDAVMWQYEGEENFRQVKQWSKVPFTIAEEGITE